MLLNSNCTDVGKTHHGYSTGINVPATITRLVNDQVLDAGFFQRGQGAVDNLRHPSKVVFVASTIEWQELLKVGNADLEA